MLPQLFSLLFISYTHAFFWSSGPSPEWDGLKAGFGINPLSSKTFDPLPRSMKEAVKEGWTRDSSVSCGTSPHLYQGDRYIKDGDTGAMLLFGKNGYIAGIQAGIPKESDPTKYPNPNNAKYHVFTEESNMMVTTAYFVEPDQICSEGRSSDDFTHNGTGTILAFKVGESGLLRIPKEESSVLSQTNFVAGQCFWGMGMHYWYDNTADYTCDTTFPVFLLYNRGKLNGFGWAFNPDYGTGSWRWEHPTKGSFSMFLPTNPPPPPCLGADGPTSTLHIYMTNSPSTNFC